MAHCAVGCVGGWEGRDPLAGLCGEAADGGRPTSWRRSHGCRSASAFARRRWPRPQLPAVADAATLALRRKRSANWASWRSSAWEPVRPRECDAPARGSIAQPMPRRHRRLSMRTTGLGGVVGDGGVERVATLAKLRTPPSVSSNCVLYGQLVLERRPPFEALDEPKTRRVGPTACAAAS